jgi:hypothetical protein
MSIIQKLSEGIVNRDMKAEGQALLNKWSQTGLLEGLQNDQSKHNMARLLENQAKELLRESSSMAGGDVEGFAAVAFPIVRRVFAGLIANELVSVQPLSLPSGLIFFLDFQFTESRYTTNADTAFPFGADDSLYGGNVVGAGLIDGVNLNPADRSGAGGYRDLSTGYAAPTGSVALADGGANAIGSIGDNQVADKDATGIACPLGVTPVAISALTEAQKKSIDFDPDLLNATSTDKLALVVVKLSTANMAQADTGMLTAWTLTDDDFTQAEGAGSGHVIRRLTHLGYKDANNNIVAGSKAQHVSFYIHGDGSVDNDHAADSTVFFPLVDTISAGTPVGSVVGGSQWGLENQESIPEIDIKVDSTAITAQTKKLKAKWTPELGQDLNAYHNLDAEVELTSILSEQIALEIDREILADLVNGATAGTFYWSRSPGLFVNRTTGAEIGQTSAAPDFTGTVSEWYETLIETINDVSAQIHRKTLRGGANFVVCSPEVANILEFTSGFRANVTADADRGDIGAVKTGSLSRKFDVMVDPYFPRNVILVGRKGNSFRESGYVYAPYVPLQVTPTIFGTEDFVPRKGVMTRYAKKMVRPDMYGLVIVRGLLGEAGATS